MPEPGDVSTIALLTDFGIGDGYPAAMKGVILRLNPGATLVDISHEVDRHDIEAGAYVLASVYRYFPAGTVFLAVVDPGVGGPRRPIVVRTPDYGFVGPDNGIFSLIYRREKQLQVNLISDMSFCLSPIADTFHGRDIFAPVAAHLSLGTDPDRFGPSLNDYLRDRAVGPVISGDRLACRIVHVDRFGSLVTDLDRQTLQSFCGDRDVRLIAGSIIIAGISNTYSDVKIGEPLALFGSAGTLEVAVNQGSAAELAGLGRGDSVEIKTARHRGGS
ncbi:S-adenosyl-l-methionine hydroxide adenosyltransferase family protein [candidate division KSB1 bacterium]